MDSCIEEFKDGVPELGPTVDWAKCFGATEVQAAAISHFLDQSVCDFNCTGEFTDEQMEQLQAIWDNDSLDQRGQVTELVNLLGL